MFIGVSLESRPENPEFRISPETFTRVVMMFTLLQIDIPIPTLENHCTLTVHYFVHSSTATTTR